MVKMCRERVEATGKILVRKVETSVNFFFLFFLQNKLHKNKDKYRAPNKNTYATYGRNIK